MSISDISRENLAKELHAHEYILVSCNDNELRIKGLPTITPIMIVVMTAIGLTLSILGIVSLFLKDPEYIAGVLLTLAGIILILLPIYNYYSRSYYEVWFDKKKNSVKLSYLTPFPKRRKIKYDDIQSLIISKNKLNAFVDDTTKSSYIHNHSIYLNLKDHSRPPIVQLSKRDENIEILSSQFADILVELTGKQKEIEIHNK